MVDFGDERAVHKTSLENVPLIGSLPMDHVLQILAYFLTLFRRIVGVFQNAFFLVQARSICIPRTTQQARSKVIHVHLLALVMPRQWRQHLCGS